MYFFGSRVPFNAHQNVNEIPLKVVFGFVRVQISVNSD